ncbi:MAG: 16S rRNA (guanine(966)-N(2))-methyltransferase RsmD [Candidatus Dasytiphilus stammeri]
MTRSVRTIRIIGGCFRGRKLIIPTNHLLRPTPNKVRETLFNWITNAFNLKYADCLDCYAGSGALAIEALSRNANTVTLLELHKSSVRQIKKNCRTLGISLHTPKIRVIHTNTLSWLSQNDTSFNMVFIDPPFQSLLVEITIKLLEKYKKLTNGSWIYIENSIYHPVLNCPANWLLYRQAFTGQVSYSLYYRR